MVLFATIALLLAAVPAALFFANLRIFRSAPAADAIARVADADRPAPDAATSSPAPDAAAFSPAPDAAAFSPAPDAAASPPAPRISVLIPARNEIANIGPCLRCVLAGGDGDVEAIVLDDDSTDGTAQEVAKIAATDARVRLESAPPLPPGWCGKQHACWRLAELARGQILLFLDADVRLTPGAVIRGAAELQRSGAKLVSGFPRQRTETFVEGLLLPLIHFVLLGFLPLRRMRGSTSPGFGAGCGQLMVAWRDAYFAAGGHAAIRSSLHDGIMMPRVFRRAGMMTDLFDATDLAVCRMYHGAAQTWRGLGKNAIEGMAAPAAIVPWTILLIGGQVVPWIGACVSGARGEFGLAWWLFVAGATMGLLVRLAGARRFAQSTLGALLHPLGIMLLIVIQWQALVRGLCGKPSHWRGRNYAQVGGRGSVAAELGL